MTDRNAEEAAGLISKQESQDIVPLQTNSYKNMHFEPSLNPHILHTEPRSSAFGTLSVTK